MYAIDRAVTTMTGGVGLILVLLAVSCFGSDESAGQSTGGGPSAGGDAGKSASSAQSGPPGRPGAGRARPYPVMKVQPQSVTLSSSYPANLRGYQTVEIRPRVQGYIEAIAVEDGDIVGRGQVLFRLSSDEYQQNVRSARADLQAAKAAVTTARTDVNRLEPLVDEGIISEYRLDKARDQLQSRKAGVAQAKAALENAQVNLDYTRVNSPTQGVVGNIPYRVGSLVSSTIEEPLTTVSDISRVYAYFSMSEQQLLQMTQTVAGEGGRQTLQQRVGQMPRAKLVLPDGSAYPKRGVISLASGLINESTGSASFRALFPNPNEVLRTGGSGTVKIPYTRQSALLAPKKATYEIQNKRFVYTVDNDNTVASTPIEVLALSTEQSFVVTDGLSAGDTIVTSGTGSLEDGTTIEPMPQ